MSTTHILIIFRSDCLESAKSSNVALCIGHNVLSALVYTSKKDRVNEIIIDKFVDAKSSKSSILMTNDQQDTGKD